MLYFANEFDPSHLVKIKILTFIFNTFGHRETTRYFKKERTDSSILLAADYKNRCQKSKATHYMGKIWNKNDQKSE